MRIIAFYTVNTPYEEEARIWQESFKDENYHVFSVESRGSWEENCAIKPEIIRQAFELFPKEDILYVDIDGRRKNPIPPSVPNPHVPGICFWNQRWNFNVRELLSSTLYIPNNPLGKKMVDLWINYQLQNPKIWDQKVLQHVVEKHEIPHDVLGYEWISMDKHINPPFAYIHHEQASRRHKRNIRRVT